MKNATMPPRNPEILLVDDSPSDLDLIRDALLTANCPGHVNTVPDGEEAIAFLHRAGRYENAIRPDFIILDLNLPRKDGRVVLADFKAEPTLRSIPVVVFTTSHARTDIARSYELGANCYVSKPGSLNDFRKAVQAIQQFWLAVATLPD
jgi:two-component system, chemotaxis family, response regulator Rcp1